MMATESILQVAQVQDLSYIVYSILVAVLKTQAF